MRIFLLTLSALASACAFYTDDPVLTDKTDAGIDATPVDVDALVEDSEFFACGELMPCPAPSGGRVTMCGQIYDVGTAEPVASGAGLDIQFYDPLAYAANPSGSSPLEVESLELFDCGAFRAVNVTRPFNGFIAVVVDDDGAGGADERVPTLVSRVTEAPLVLSNIRAVTTLRTTDAKWTATAGNPFDAASFAEVGVYLGVFLGPAAGVTIQPGGATAPADDFYFSDLTAARSEVDPAMSSTGANGSALLVNGNLGQFRGEGGLPEGCEWTPTLSASVPGVVWYGEHYEDCPTE